MPMIPGPVPARLIVNTKLEMSHLCQVKDALNKVRDSLNCV